MCLYPIAPREAGSPHPDNMKMSDFEWRKIEFISTSIRENG